MARKINSRLRITGILIAETPLHVGGYGDSPDTDLPLAQNGKGDWYVPGTSVAGVLRSWCEKNFEERETIKELFGPRRVPGKEEGHASFVLVEDATIDNAKEVLTEIRDGVGIDRFYGVAADKAKYDRAILPRGTQLNFDMTIEINAKKEPNPKAKEEKEKEGESDTAYKDRVKKTKAVIGHLLEALTKSKLRFGASKTRGLGSVKLKGKRTERGELQEEPEIKEQGLVGFDAIISMLNSGGDVRTIEHLKDEDPNTKANSGTRLEIKIEWEPRLPVMVKAGYDGIGVDMLPITSGIDKDNLALVLPGSSIKGVLRSQAERIMRTLLPDCNCTKGKKFNDQIDAIPLVEELFGSRSKSKDEAGSGTVNHEKCISNPEAKLGLGALSIDDCYAKEGMNADLWRKVEVALDDKPKVNVKESNQEQKEAKSEAGEVSYFKRELWRYLREIDERDLLDADYAKDTSRFKIHHHVAIDRWTGGAAEGALYSVLAPEKIEWEPMRLTLDFGRIDRESRLRALMLLLLTLRDVAENRLPLGFGPNRGMGEIEVKSYEFIGSGKLKLKKLSEKDGKIVEDEEIEIDLKDALSATVEAGRCKFAEGILREQIQLRWKQWLK
jgi:CRISPR/Cas system CSM-associated protein Csm3 (group 7 of RAMP superfamily)